MRLALALVAVGQVPAVPVPGVPVAVSTEPLPPFGSRLLAVPLAGRCWAVALGAVEAAAWSPAQLLRALPAPSPKDAPVMERSRFGLKVLLSGVCMSRQRDGCG